MAESLIGLHIGLVSIVFLVVLNGYLRGAKKVQIDATLSVLWLILLGIGFVSYGWKVGLTALVLSFIYALISKPIAASTARRVLGYRTTFGSSGLSSPTDLSVEAILGRHEETDRRITQIAQKSGIAKILNENVMTAEDLKEQFHFLMRIGLGDLAWEVISTPKDLKLLLDLRRQQLSPLEIASRLMQ